MVDAITPLDSAVIKVSAEETTPRPTAKPAATEDTPKTMATKVKEVDPLVLQAQSILSQKVAESRSGQVPGTAGGAASVDQDDIFSKLPVSHKQLLRQYYQDPMNGEWQAYFVGSLKSFSSQKGFGFLSCSAAFQYWGVDVFIHKNQVPVPWNVGQPVEFAVCMNNRGQPQATDCAWLPQLPKQRPALPTQGVPLGIGGYQGGIPNTANLFSPNDPSAKAAPPVVASAPSGTATASAAATDAGPENESLATRKPSDGPFYLGILKSYSSAQGYGFIQCDDVHKIYKRDIYFDRVQLPRPPVYNAGQTLEFAVGQNGKGQPQARQLLWDCVPVLQKEEETTGEHTQPREHFGKHSPASLEKLRKLLRLLNDGDPETAVVTAIDYQGVQNEKAPDAMGVPNAEASMPDVDYVTYVLDRLGSVDEAVTKIKDFVRMLLLLMLAKLLKKRSDAERVQKLTRWLVALSEAIDVNTEKQVQLHFLDVVSQIESNLRGALVENPHTQEASASKSVHEVLEQLQTKAAKGAT